MNDFQNRKRNERPASTNVLLGLLVIAVGVVILMRKMDIPFFPYWIFSWPMILIVVGLFVGIKNNFTNVGWLILVLLGSFFLLDDVMFFNWHLREFAFPLGIIVIGIFLIFRSVVSPNRNIQGRFRDRFQQAGETQGETHEYSEEEKKRTLSDDEEYVNSTNIFGSTKKRIFSKSFRGGQTTNFFGGTVLDLSQADIDKSIVIDVIQVFGGVKLIMPANWVVKSDVVSIFGGLDDKRNMAPSDPDKVVVLTGVCIFGGIDIKSY